MTRFKPYFEQAAVVDDVKVIKYEYLIRLLFYEVRQRLKPVSGRVSRFKQRLLFAMIEIINSFMYNNLYYNYYDHKLGKVYFNYFKTENITIKIMIPIV